MVTQSSIVVLLQVKLFQQLLQMKLGPNQGNLSPSLIEFILVVLVFFFQFLCPFFQKDLLVNQRVLPFFDSLQDFTEAERRIELLDLLDRNCPP